MKDPIEIIQDSITSVKDDISSLADKYNSSVKEIWIKLTELETRIKVEKSFRDSSTESKYKTWPIVISIIALIITIVSFVRSWLLGT